MQAVQPLETVGFFQIKDLLKLMLKTWQINNANLCPKYLKYIFKIFFHWGEGNTEAFAFKVSDLAVSVLDTCNLSQIWCLVIIRTS